MALPPTWAKRGSYGSKLVRPRPGLPSWARMCGEATSPQHSAESLSLARPGHPAFVQAWAEERLRTEQQLFDQLPKLPDLQCALLLLRLCASPRANHAIRTMPPSQSAAYAHDAAVWATLQALLRGPSEQDNGLAREVAALPAALGVLGLQSAELTAPRLTGSHGPTRYRPFATAYLGAQMHALRIHTEHDRDRVLMPALSLSSQAMLRLQAGPHAGAWLTAIPCEPATTMPLPAMQIALRRRLRLPLPLSPNRCGPNPGCGGPVDALGDHTLACSRTGLVARRAKVVERAWVRVAHWLTYTTAPGDRRRLDLVVYGATAHGGALCCDATLVSPLTRTGHPQPCTAEVDGAALQNAANTWHTPSLREAGRKNCSCSVARSEAGGVQGRSASSATWCASELSARPLPCELPRLQAGRGAGGEHFPWRSSWPWRAQHLDAHGRRPRNQDRAMAPLGLCSRLCAPKRPSRLPLRP